MKESGRNLQLEKDLQGILDNGDNVWVIGDVHGFSKTLRQLITKLTLSPEDSVVILGDLVDRGPNSFVIVQYINMIKFP